MDDLKALARELLGRHAPLDQGVVTTKSALRAIEAALSRPAGGLTVPRAKLQQAIERAKVFDDGSDGADAESARSVASILSEALAAAPTPHGGEDARDAANDAFQDVYNGDNLRTAINAAADAAIAASREVDGG